ncbi:hypothetical protein J3R30DRAFT_3380237 [Lentinula aciculospora]|uniref:F-box domain-containing protein n=1 Tax=Lentinula aciculospora TaxID=153920 RepID=A0A9W9A0B5_9AGAR|nr:hypothetical protein J3R30DRAFT_3380237 [Lentinula aciculospora]
MTVGSPRSSLVASFSRTNLRVNLDGVSVSPSNHYWAQNQAQSLQKADCEEGKPLEDPPAQQERKGTEIMSLHLLPYDLLLNIASYLEYVDVHVLQLTCKSLYYSFTTRPVYRKLATDLLRRCRPLPLKGFQRLGDLSTNQLIRSVNKAHQYERAWLVRAPRPIGAAAMAETVNGTPKIHNNYLDLESQEGSTVIPTPKSWYKVVRAPPGEEVDWLSPITSSYTLCATKSGKVVCWDVQTDTCLAQWNPGERWELWKCRVEFEDKMVYFTMAKVLHGSNSYDDSRVMEFSLMRLQFYENALGRKTAFPTFSPVTLFKTVGVVMNIFLLDPSARLLSAFVWVSSSNSIGLYVLLDWEKDEYVFIDTGIECVMSSNWSCILFEKNIVIHCEDSDAAFQHFYPLALLETHSRQLKSKRATPTLSCRVIPFESIVKRFTFPTPRLHSIRRNVNVAGVIPITVIDSQTGAIITPMVQSPASMPSSFIPNTNPYPFPPWYPESAHFVRQWWPTLPHVPRISCTVVLLASHDPVTHKTRFVLAQHYFRVPMRGADWIGFAEKGKTGPARRETHGADSDSSKAKGKARARTAENDDEATSTVQDDTAIEDDALRLWYVSTPFEVVCLEDPSLEDDDGEGVQERPRPLVAVDFGHAVWIEYFDQDMDPETDVEDDDNPRMSAGNGFEEVDLELEQHELSTELREEQESQEHKRLRFVTFPPFMNNGRVNDAHGGWGGADVRTLEIPPELDLHSVETINIDQSQGAIILSVKQGRIFILCYE